MAYGYKASITVELKARCRRLMWYWMKFANWYSKRFLNRPVKFYSSPKSFVRNVCFFRPVSKAKSFFIKSEKVIPSKVSVLLVSRLPPAVIRRVITVVINSAKSVFWGGFFTHIFNKIFKLIPFFTKFYSSTAIVFVVRIFRIITSRFRSSSRVIFVGITSSMSSHQFSSGFFLQITHNNYYILTQR
jgi:hypothetical protein